MKRACAASSSIFVRRSHIAIVNGGSSSSSQVDLIFPYLLFHFRSKHSSRMSRSIQLNRLVDDLFRSVPSKISDANTDNRLVLNRALSLFDLLLQTPPVSNSNSNPIVPFNKLFTVVTRIGLHPSVVIVGVVLDYLCKNKRLVEAMSLVRKMEIHGSNLGIITYNILINGMCKVGKFEMARDLFRGLPSKGLQPDVWTHNILINGLCKHGLFSEAESLFSKMEENGCSPDECSYNMMIRGFIQNQETKKAIQLIDIMVVNGFSADAFTTETVLYQLIHDRSFREMMLGSQEK